MTPLEQPAPFRERTSLACPAPKVKLSRIPPKRCRTWIKLHKERLWHRDLRLVRMVPIVLIGQRFLDNAFSGCDTAYLRCRMSLRRQYRLRLFGSVFLLAFPHLSVDAFRFQELAMAAALCDLAILKDEYFIRVYDC